MSLRPPFGEPLAHPSHERMAAAVAKAMSRRRADIADRLLEDSSRHWGFLVAAAIDARAQELVAAGEALIAEEIRSEPVAMRGEPR